MDSGTHAPKNLVVSAAFRGIFHEIAARFFVTFEERRARGVQVTASESRAWEAHEEWVANRVRATTAQALLQVACAIDSPDSVDLVIEHCPSAFSMQSTAAHWGSVAPKGPLPLVSAALTAIAFSAHGSLDAMMKHGWTAQQPVASYPKEQAIPHRDDPRKDMFGNSAMLSEVLSFGLVNCRLDMAKRLLDDVLRLEDGSFHEFDRQPLFESAHSALTCNSVDCGDVAKLLQLFVKAGVYEINPTRAAGSAALVGQLDVLRKLEGSIAWEKLLSQPQSSIINTILDSRIMDVFPERFEPVLEHIMERAQEAGEGVLLYAPSARNRRSILETIFEKKLYRLLKLHIDNGLSPEQELEGGRTVLEVAVDVGNQCAVDMLLSVRARNQTNNVLDLLEALDDHFDVEEAECV